MRFMRWISLLVIAGSLAISLPTAQAAPPLQQPGVGEICVRAFNDINGDGTFTPPDELLLADVTFILSNETGRLSSYRTDGTEDNAYCFGNLAVGQYTVQARPDANKVKGKATTPGQWVVPLASGAQYDIAYGVNVGAKPESGQANAGSTSSSGMSPVGRIALGLLGAAVLGVAGYLAYLILRRARSA